MVTEGQTFTLTAAVSDDLDPAPTSPRVLSVTSDEAIDGTGDGHASPDWHVTGDMSLNLRAERSGSGSGRCTR